MTYDLVRPRTQEHSVTSVAHCCYQAERTGGKEREKNLAAVAKLKEEEAKLSNELQKYRDRDPVVLKALSKCPSLTRLRELSGLRPGSHCDAYRHELVTGMIRYRRLSFNESEAQRPVHCQG